MKTFLLLAASFSIALAQVASAENQDEVKKPKTRAKVPQTSRNVAPPKTVSPGPHINRNTVQPNQYHPKVQYPASAYTNRTTRNTVPPKQYRPKVQYPASAYTNTTTRNTVPPKQYRPKAQYPASAYTNTTTRNAVVPKTSTTVQPNAEVRNQNWQNRTNRNTTVQNQNWQNQNNNHNNNSWTEARRRHHRHHHNRNWWRSHFTRFALFGSGYYFWDGGYWYPAYGYDPGYNTYAYNEPIYGYNDLDPGQVVSSVQTELQRLGYYRYAVDGQMGPLTRAAISRYQRDTGLAITSAIDEPTLQSLGLR